MVERGVSVSRQALIEAVLSSIRSHRFLYDNEIQLQDGLAECFTKAGIAFEREARLSPANKIDFMLPEGVGLEVKIKGSPTEVARQLLAYVGEAQVLELILVTGRAVLGRLPDELLGKRIHVVPLWRSFL